MKRLILILFLCALTSGVHAQQTVIVQRPGILTDLTEAAGALVSLPFALAEGVVAGTAEAVGSLIHGSTHVIVTPSPIGPTAQAMPPVQVVQPRIVTPATPVVVMPSSTVVVSRISTEAIPQSSAMTTITTTYQNGTAVSVTRPASSYELGPAVVIPVAPEHRVGTSPFVNPYVAEAVISR